MSRSALPSNGVSISNPNHTFVNGDELKARIEKMASEAHDIKRSFEDVAPVIENGPPTLRCEWMSINKVCPTAFIDVRGLISPKEYNDLVWQSRGKAASGAESINGAELPFVHRAWILTTTPKTYLVVSSTL